ncbi:GGDEF domain-containing protein [Hydrogenobaculum acidophilum]
MQTLYKIKRFIATSITHKLVFRLLVLMISTVVIMEGIFAISFREQGIRYALSKANTVASIVRDGLTSLMVMGVIKDRESYIKRLERAKGVTNIHIVRGEAVDKQFGPGLPTEQPIDNLEKLVLLTGKPIYKIYESPSKVLVRDIIPYKASNKGIVNCLQCHEVQNGQVLGAIDITLDVTEIRYKAFLVMLTTLLIFVGLFGALSYSIFRFSKPYIDMFNKLIKSFGLLQEGRFEEAKINDGGILESNEMIDEAGKVVIFFNKMVEILHNALNSIHQKAFILIGYDVMNSGNTIKDTDKIVTELANIYKFKKTIEKDSSKEDIYERLRLILENYMALDKFSLYEVNYDKMKLIFVNGTENLWCKEDILKDNSCCRAYRTGADVDSDEFPNVCKCFIKEYAEFQKQEDDLEYYCIPIYLNGHVHNVLQIVYENYMKDFVHMIIPYIKGYIDEAIPVMESKLLMEKLKEQSIKDQLTGFYNRRYIEEAIEPILNNAKRKNETIGILILDIDHFKEVNDTYGHDAGDMVLKSVAQAIKESIRSSDIPIRFGGEEFLVLLTNVKPGESEHIAEKIRKNVENRAISLPNKTTIKKTISIGVSEIPTDTDRFWQAVKFADVALYKAKESGRNKVVRYQKDMWQEEEY